MISSITAKLKGKKKINSYMYISIGFNTKKSNNVIYNFKNTYIRPSKEWIKDFKIFVYLGANIITLVSINLNRTLKEILTQIHQHYSLILETSQAIFTPRKVLILIQTSCSRSAGSSLVSACMHACICTS